ncbi:hypothetical protein HMPREF0973_02870 [Prevotella veroralis F0319]|uniref:Uncharacterized protein n=1 Tax=Prevotella veroralis F0319 TaxID=649761 RepID=C9MT99_9BACT|nr:hypothetical protein HMPREF0973_02870 [Prevotella veroralis F0319]
MQHFYNASHGYWKEPDPVNKAAEFGFFHCSELFRQYEQT